MIRHIVAVHFRAEVTDAQKAEIYDALRALSDHLPGILEFRSFANISPEEPVVRGFKDLFWIDFQGPDARDAYLVDPGHKAIGAKLVALAEGEIAGVQVLDVVV
ncbi:MAG: Dabb family protein [Paracoccaceae bacterium]